MVYGARLESVLGSRPHEFESRILRQFEEGSQEVGSLLHYLQGRESKIEGLFRLQRKNKILGFTLTPK